jgi:hypothetical protein
MAISKTDLLNKSLTLVGAAPITNIDDDTNNARILNRVYEISLRMILSECKWNFATKRVLLTVSAETMAWNDTGEVYIYVKPIDMIRLYDTSEPRASYREEGDLIISDTTDLGIRYVYFLDVPSKYPGYFIDAFCSLLAAEIAYMIVNSASLAEKHKAYYEKVALPKATSANSQTGVQQVLKDDAWEVAKWNDLQETA